MTKTVLAARRISRSGRKGSRVNLNIRLTTREWDFAFGAKPTLLRLLSNEFTVWTVA
jgi:hypothetical protein